MSLIHHTTMTYNDNNKIFSFYIIVSSVSIG